MVKDTILKADGLRLVKSLWWHKDATPNREHQVPVLTRRIIQKEATELHWHQHAEDCNGGGPASRKLCIDSIWNEALS